MNDPGWRFRAKHLFEWLLMLYPPRFRSEFATEIRDIILSRLGEAEKRGGLALLTTAFLEIVGLVTSILYESWHELRVRKEKKMVPEDQLHNDVGTGMPAMQPAGTPSFLWFTGWTLLTTAALPAAYIMSPLLAVMFMWLINLGVKTGFWSTANSVTPGLVGFLTSFALVLASAQWYLLRNFLPRAWLWFIATGTGVLLGGLATELSTGRSSAQYWPSIMAAALLQIGLALGLTQWLYLRRFLPNAFWIVFVNLLAAPSILLAGNSFNSLTELIVVLLLPGAITGLGLWLLLNQSHPKMTNEVRIEASRQNSRWLPRRVWTGLGLAAMVPLFFVCIWIYAASQLALAKNEGVYPTVEEAVIGDNSLGWGGARVIAIEDVHAGPNRHDGVQPHVWFGGAKVYLDRVPEGGKRDWYLAGSYYIHVRDGWVLVPEGAFPEFIGWVMELYHMEGVNQ